MTKSEYGRLLIRDNFYKDRLDKRKWISVKNGLPSAYDWVLVLGGESPESAEDDNLITIACLEPESLDEERTIFNYEWNFLYASDPICLVPYQKDTKLILHRKNITHWMHLCALYLSDFNN